MTRRLDVAVVLMELTKAYPKFDLKEETAEIYVSMLLDIPAELLSAAAQQHIGISSFLPTIAELRERAASLVETAEGVRSPVEAWEWASKWISSSGQGRSEGDDLSERAIRAIGGWEWLGQQKVADRHWTQKRFLEAYGDLLESQRGYERMVPAARRIASGRASESVRELLDKGAGNDVED